MVRNRQIKLTKHHIIPVSRGGISRNNIAYVPSKQHELYHSLFMNKTPKEIVDYLNRDFWNSQYSGIEKLAQ